MRDVLTVSAFKTYMLAIIVTIIGLLIIIFPKDSLDASVKGLTMWWEIVFPSLLPFFIVSELMIGFGVVSFIGVILEPFMRPFFRVPGVGGFVWAMGVASGFPAGAKFTARLRQEKQLSTIEGERLVSFTNSSNPLFMGGAIAVGFFHNAALGLVIMISHYLGNILVGFIMRFHGIRQEETPVKNKKLLPSLKTALHEMHQTRLNDDRPLGKLLGDSVNSAIQTLLMIGGFIILFSMLNKVLSTVNVSQLFATFLGGLLAVFNIPSELGMPLFSGMFEITIGSKMASETEQASLLYQVMITSCILGFNGFSIQAQVASILAETDIRFQPFFIARLMHGMFAAMFTFLLWKPLYENIHKTSPQPNVIAAFSQGETMNAILTAWQFIVTIGPAVTLCSLLFFIIYQLKNIPRV